MDRRERMNNLTVAMRSVLRTHQATIWTALPAFVNSYNAAAITVSAQPTIQAQVRTPPGKVIPVTLPLCEDVPVLFSGGGHFLLSFPLVTGDEGLLVFSSRCLDAWWQSSGINPQAELRMHDLSDGFFFPTSGMSQPNVAPNMSVTTMQLRDKSGTLFLELDPVTSQCNILAPGGLWVNGVKVTVP
jgi:hypothetical protein